MAQRTVTCRHCNARFEYTHPGKAGVRSLCSDECKRAKLREAKARYRAANREKHAASNSAWNKANPARTAVADARWRESHRGQYLEQQRFYNNERRRTPLEAVLEYQRRRRAAKKSCLVGRVTPDLLAVKWTYWSGRCWLCPADATEWDHVKPLIKGGAHCLANLRPACRSCNAHKSDRWPFSTARRR